MFSELTPFERAEATAIQFNLSLAVAYALRECVENLHDPSAQVSHGEYDPEASLVYVAGVMNDIMQINA